ncbi:DUF1045 domain-containing protein [Rhodospirillum sp. A1_3_36]|uniref:DUF1045 domain-containing protein n=1 Tax=Rhodospirillum sp. A1_3_36 TaxID=3391666 RepID=UPI0039A4FBEA
MSERHAIYLSPPATHPLAVLAERWLGRGSGRPSLGGYPDTTLEAWTAEPRRYGFHGTLKAPFTLTPGRTLDDLDQAIAALAKGHPAPPALALEIAALGPFLALISRTPTPALDALAARCVTELDGFRAPPSARDLARRKPETLSPHHRALFERWGYPYVLEEFRFHMTLTGPIPEPGDRDRMKAALTDLFTPVLTTPLSVEDIARVSQSSPSAPFQEKARFRLLASPDLPTGGPDS